MKKTTPKADLIAYVSNVPKIKDYNEPIKLVTEVQQIIERCSSIYYGIRPGLLDDALIESVISEIIKRFGTLSVNEIEHSFERAVIIKEDWRNLTKRELIEPIESWYNKKEGIRVDFEKFKEESEEIEAGKVKAKEFLDQSICVYNESLESLEWLGTIFQASAIAKDYISESIDIKKRAELWNEAIRKFKEAKEITKLNAKTKHKLIPENFGYSTSRLYSELIVEEGIKQQIQINEV